MKLKKLYVFVEGIDDVMFVENIFFPILMRYYNDIDVIQYAQMKKLKTNKLIDSIGTLGFDYLILADIDQEPSFNHKRKVIQDRFPVAELRNIVIVISEIES